MVIRTTTQARMDLVGLSFTPASSAHRSAQAPSPGHRLLGTIFGYRYKDWGGRSASLLLIAASEDGTPAHGCVGHGDDAVEDAIGARVELPAEHVAHCIELSLTSDSIDCAVGVGS